MATIINASTSSGLVQSADLSGILKVQSNGSTTNAIAWVNFNGTNGAIRASYNVSSVTRNGTGDYVINFTNAMTDNKYCLVGSVLWAPGTEPSGFVGSSTALTTMSSGLNTLTNGSDTTFDYAYVYVAYFGN